MRAFFFFLTGAAAALAAFSRTGHILMYAPGRGFTCRLAATPVSLKKGCLVCGSCTGRVQQNRLHTDVCSRSRLHLPPCCHLTAHSHPVPEYHAFSSLPAADDRSHPAARPRAAG
ncbi:hypothetical protein C1Y41_05415 [Pantoea sp. ICBG 1758]|nr:hypothetical protein C1Y41_05415 [Pantoea sp. ICBG 1758]